MLISIFIALYFAFSALFGSGHLPYGELMNHHVKNQIKAVVDNEDQREEALAALKVMNKDIDTFNKMIEGDVKELTKLIQDYHSTPTDFDQRLASASEKNKQQIDKLWDDRQVLLSHIKPTEWNTIISNAKTKMETK